MSKYITIGLSISNGLRNLPATAYRLVAAQWIGSVADYTIPVDINAYYIARADKPWLGSDDAVQVQEHGRTLVNQV